MLSKVIKGDGTSSAAVVGNYQGIFKLKVKLYDTVAKSAEIRKQSLLSAIKTAKQFDHILPLKMFDLF